MRDKNDLQGRQMNGDRDDHFKNQLTKFKADNPRKEMNMNWRRLSIISKLIGIQESST